MTHATPHPNVCLLHEPIVGAFGLPADTPFVSIKGDPSLRETVPLRPRQQSRLDQIAGEVLQACAALLRDTGVYAIYVGFNSSEVRTESVFNPFAYEVHDAEDLVKPGYTARHFVTVPYEEKVRTIAWVRAMIQSGPLRHYLPAHWLKLMASTKSCRASTCCAASKAITCAMRRFHCPRASCVRPTTATAPTSCGPIISPSSFASTRPERRQSSGVST